MHIVIKVCNSQQQWIVMEYLRLHNKHNANSDLHSSCPNTYLPKYCMLKSYGPCFLLGRWLLAQWHSMQIQQEPPYDMNTPG